MRSKKYPHLFSPIEIKGKTFKNRIMVSPMGLGEPGEPGVISEEGLRFYEAIAAGGSARICTGSSDVVFGSAVFGKYFFFMDPVPEKTAGSVRRYADICHRYGALAFCSFDHMGVYCRTAEKMAKNKMLPPPPCKPDGTPYAYPENAFGPSELTICEPYDGVTSRLLAIDDDNGKHVLEMSEVQMEEIAIAFAHAARGAKDSGLDGMVIHAGHGFLFSQWVSRRFNKRTDKYGGSMENRARFPILCLQRIREAVGDDFLVEMRFSAQEDISPIDSTEYIPETVTIPETVEFFKELDKYPGLLDIAHITGGLHTVPVYNTRVTANSYFPIGVNVAGAAAVKAAVKNIKVGVVGSLSDPAVCEQVIAEGKADFVILCRQLLMSDPAFPQKAEQGRDEQIDNCLRCVLCHANGHCAVNPADIMLGDKDPLSLRKSAHPGHVVVVGGGIAGMKAAEYAAQNGHEVTLFERGSCLGGILRYTDHEPNKTDIKRFKDNMALRLEKDPKVRLELNTEATPAMVRALAPDAVIVAAGGETAALTVPGGELANVCDSVSAYLHPQRVGERVVVIGGGLTGCEAAIHWAGLGCRVSLVSRSEQLMKSVRPRMPADGSPDTHLILLHKLGVDIRKGCVCKEILKDGVLVETADAESFLPADTVINAVGMEPGRTSSGFYKTAGFVRVIGDCAQPGMIGDAILAARKAVAAFG